MTQSTITAGDNTANSIIVAGGDDGTLAIKVGAAGAKVNAVAFAGDGTPTFLKVPVNATAQSMVQVNTSNGYGSTNTMILRFTTTVTNQGSDITYTDSATLGGSFTVNTNGVYSISYTWSPGVSGYGGVSLNSSQLTTSIATITLANKLIFVNPQNTNQPMSGSWTGYLSAGSIVRAHNDSGASGTAATQFTITRVA